MKKSVLLLGLVILLTGCTQVNNKVVPLKTPHKSVLRQALKNGDITTAVNSLYYLIEEEGVNSTYKDSLAFLYFQTRGYQQCEIVSKEILSRDSSKVVVLEMMAASQSAMGKTILSIESYEKLYPMTKDIYHVYKLSELQFIVKRLAEAYSNIQIAENSTSKEEDKINFTVGKNQVQPVVIKAAIYNLKGVIEKELFPDKPELAKVSFNNSLELEPEFVVAKNNLDLISEK